MPNTNFQTPNFTYFGLTAGIGVGVSISMFPFSSELYDDVFISDNSGNLHVLYGGSSFSTLPSILISNELDGIKGFQTTGIGSGGDYRGNNLCGVKNFLGDNRNAAVIGRRANEISYVIFYKPTIGATLDLTTSSDILKFQGAYSLASFSDENGRSVDAGTVNGRGVIIFGAPGTTLNGDITTLAGAVNIVCGQSVTNTDSIINVNDITALKINGQTRTGQLGFSVRFIPNIFNGKPGILAGEPGNSKAYLIPLNPATVCNLGQTFDLNTLNGANGVAITSTVPNFGISVAYGKNIFGEGKPGIVIASPSQATTDPNGAFVIRLDPSLFNQGSISINQLRTTKKAFLISGLGYDQLGYQPTGVYNKYRGTDAILLSSYCSATGEIITVGERDTDIDVSHPDGEAVIEVPDFSFPGIYSGGCLSGMVAGNVTDDNTVTIAKGVSTSSFNNIFYRGHVDFYFANSLGRNSQPNNGTPALPPPVDPSENTSTLALSTVLAISAGGFGTLLLLALFLFLLYRHRKNNTHVTPTKKNEESNSSVAIPMDQLDDPYQPGMPITASSVHADLPTLAHGYQQYDEPQETNGTSNQPAEGEHAEESIHEDDFKEIDEFKSKAKQIDQGEKGTKSSSTSTRTTPHPKKKNYGFFATKESASEKLNAEDFIELQEGEDENKIAEQNGNDAKPPSTSTVTLVTTEIGEDPDYVPRASVRY
jgi:hypothetical protein